MSERTVETFYQVQVTLNDGRTQLVGPAFQESAAPEQLANTIMKYILSGKEREWKDAIVVPVLKTRH